MATPDWEAIESAYRAGVLSLRDIGDKYGVTEGAIRKRAKKFGWVRKAGTQVRKSGTQSGTQKNKVRTSEKRASAGRTQKSTQPKVEPPPDTKPIRGMRTDPPTNPFQPGNQQALKHGGYARRLLLKDEVIEDAKALTLEDELFRLRANNLVAAENIGRWLTKLEDTEGDQERKVLMENISAAEKAMMRNTVRIESIVGTLATVGKIFADTDYRKAATDKVSLEADRLRRDAGIDDGNGERDLNDFYSDIQTDTESGPA
ncbi:Putative bacteriophage protein [Klebsiella pneumoniae]